MKEMDDLISKLTAVNAVEEIGRVATLPDGDEVIRKSAVKYTLSMLPPAQPEQKWIPVSERMPEIDDGKILGCDQFGQIFIPTSIVKIEEKLYDAKDFKFDVNEFLKGRCIVDGIRMRPRIIVAWMPLPEPYKGEKE